MADTKLAEDMIHQLLSITRPLFVLDTETTGTDATRDRIVEVGFQRWEAGGMTLEWRSLVNPGVPIPEAATRVHDITNETVGRCKLCWEEEPHVTQYKEGHEIRTTPDGGMHEFHPYPTFKHLAANLAKGFADCDFAGKNVRFDLRIVAAEMTRAGVGWSYLGARIVDAERLEQLAVPRSLSHLHEKYTGAKHDGAHGALSDVRATTTVIVHQLQAYYDNTYGVALSRDLDTLHAAQWPGWIDGEGKFRFIDGVPCFSQWGKYANKPMRSADAGYWDFIINKDFSADVKALASAAKLGKFPEAK